MLDLAGLFTRPRRNREAETRPLDFVVHKDGRPFAILNATPALAARTMAGFARAKPEASWSLERD